MRKKFRFLTILAVCVMVLSCFSVTAFAYADDTEQNLPVTEATQPEQQPAVTPTPISEQVKGMSDGQLESYFANLGKKKGARPAETDE